MAGSRAAALGAVLGLVLAAPPAHAAVRNPVEQQAADQAIVGFQPGTPAAVRDTLVTAAGGQLVRALPLDMSLVRTPDPAATARLLRGRPGIRFAEPDQVYRLASDTPDDPRFADQWALPRMRVPDAWDTTLGSPGLTVGVIDSGVRNEHPDLQQAVVQGINLVRPVDSSNAHDTWDRLGHGTHVTGIIAAGRNDGIGIAGVAPGVKVMPIRVFGTTPEADEADIISAFEAAGSHGLRIVNASLGGTWSEGVERVVRAYPDTLFVLAAGNDGHTIYTEHDQMCGMSPENVLCVTATDSADQLPSYADRGWPAVDVGAPGNDILSDWPAAETLMHDDFSSGVSSRWTLAGDLEARADGTLGTDPSQPLVAGSTGTAAVRQTWSFANRTGCHVDFDADVQLSVPDGELEIQTQDSDGTWTTVDWLQSASGRVSEPLGDLSGETTTVRLRVLAGTYPGPGDHAVVDNLSIVCDVGDLPAGATDLRRLSGTSMAAPQVTGIAALLLSLRPDLRPEDVAQLIRCGAIPEDSLHETVAGRADALGALRASLAPTRPRSSGYIGVFAGDTGPYWRGESGPDATKLSFPRAREPVVMPDGSVVFVAGGGTQTVRIVRVASDGSVTTIAGDGSAGDLGDEKPATQAWLNDVEDLTATSDGSLWFVELYGVHRITPDGVMHTVVGGPYSGFTPDGGSVRGDKTLDAIWSFLPTADGGLLLTERSSSGVALRRVDSTGHIATLQVNGTARVFPGPQGTAWGSTASQFGPLDSAYHVQPVAGIAGRSGFYGDGGPALAAGIGLVDRPAFHDGSIYFDQANRIRRIAPDGTIDTILGDGLGAYSKPGTLAVDAEFLEGLATVGVLPDGRVLAGAYGDNQIATVSTDSVPVRPHAPPCASPSPSPTTVPPSPASTDPAQSPPATQAQTSPVPPADPTVIGSAGSTARPALHLHVVAARIVRFRGRRRLLVSLIATPFARVSVAAPGLAVVRRAVPRGGRLRMLLPAPRTGALVVRLSRRGSLPVVRTIKVRPLRVMRRP